MVNFMLMKYSNEVTLDTFNIFIGMTVFFKNEICKSFSIPSKALTHEPNYLKS